MITATIYQTGQQISGFKIYGHAGFAPAGEDIVCAAVSILAITVINSLIDQVSEQTEAEIAEDGMASCYLPHELDELAQLKAQAILRTLEIGLESIKTEYPKYIKLKHQ